MSIALSPFDMTLVVLYLVGVTTLGLWYSRGIRSSKDHFLAGRPVGLGLRAGARLLDRQPGHRPADPRSEEPSSGQGVVPLLRGNQAPVSRAAGPAGPDWHRTQPMPHQRSGLFEPSYRKA